MSGRRRFASTVIVIAAVTAALGGANARAFLSPLAAPPADPTLVAIDGSSKAIGTIGTAAKTVATGWWLCPSTGSCVASTLHLWLPSSGPGGHATVEAGRTTGTCGAGCYEVPNGEVITIRAVADPGYKFTGWGGKCQSVGNSTGCYFHMWNNYTAAATFVPIPAPGSPDSSGDPVTPVLEFVLQLSGMGTVVAQGMGSFVATPCQSLAPAAPPCRVTRYMKKVTLTALTTSGRPFLGWGGDGRCRGAQLSCTFKNDFGPYGAPRITARFGS
jgi:hypothetical protein